MVACPRMARRTSSSPPRFPTSTTSPILVRLPSPPALLRALTAPWAGNIIGSTLSADVFARYARQRNERVLYVSQRGSPLASGAQLTQTRRRSVEQTSMGQQPRSWQRRRAADPRHSATSVRASPSSESLSSSCRPLIDHKLHAEAYEWFQIGFDHFGRTSTPLQTE